MKIYLLPSFLILLLCFGWEVGANDLDGLKVKLEEGWEALRRDRQEEALALGREVELSLEKIGSENTPLYSEALILQGEAMWESQRWEEAELFIGSALGICDSCADYYIPWAKLAYRKAAYEETLERLDAGLKKAKKIQHRERILLEMADVGISLGYVDKACQALDSLKSPLHRRIDQLRYVFLLSERDRIKGKAIAQNTSLDELLPFYKENRESPYPNEKFYLTQLEAIWQSGKKSLLEQYDILASIRNLVLTPSFSPKLAAKYWENLSIYAQGEESQDSILTYFDRGKTALDKMYVKQHLARTEIYLDEANYLWNQGDYQEMLSLMSRLEKQILAQGFSTHNALPYIWRNQSMAYRSIGDYERSLGLIKKAVLKMEEIYPEGHWELGGFYKTLGNAYSNMDLNNPEYQEKALKVHLKALKLDQEKFGASHEVAMIFHNIGMTYMYLDNFEKAEEYYKKGLKMSVESLDPGHLNIAKSRFGLAEFYLYKGEIEKSLEQGRAAYAIYKEKVLPSHSARISITMFLGYIHAYSRGVDSAFHYLEEAYKGYFPDIGLEEMEKLAEPEYFRSYDIQNISNLLGILGDTYSDKGELKKARRAYKTLLAWIDQYELRASYSEAGWQRNSSFFYDYANLLSIDYRLYQETGDPIYNEEAFALADKAKTNTLRYHLQGKRSFDFSDISQAERERGRQLHQAYNEAEKRYLKDRQVNLDPTIMNRGEVEFQQNKQAYLDWQRSLEKKYPRYYQLKYDQHLVYPDEVRDKIGDGKTLVVEYFLMEGQYLFKIAFDEEKTIHLVDTLDGTFEPMIDSFIQMLRPPEFAENRSFDKEAFDKFTEMGHALYRGLLGDVLAEFGNKNFEELLIIPSGRLTQLNFDILLSEEREYDHVSYQDLPYLIRDYNIRYEYAASLIQGETQADPPPSFAYLGVAPVFNDQYRKRISNKEKADSPGWGLQFNQKEVEEAYQLLGGKKLQGEEAREALTKKYLEEAAILHFATHTFLNDTFPMYTSLVLERGNDSLEDGLLHAYEIYPKNLRANLAVLSACETGLGKWRKGEGMMSLARAFKYAGCPNIVMSLWQADDQTSADVMASFFSYLKQGLPKDQALRKAKVDFLDKGSGKQFPHYWAPFVLIGDDTPVEVSSFGWSRQNWMLLGCGLGALLLGFVYLSRRRS